MACQDCNKCEHKINNNSDGFCYMFETQVEGDCAQFISFICSMLKDRIPDK